MDDATYCDHEWEDVDYSYYVHDYKTNANAFPMWISMSSSKVVSS